MKARLTRLLSVLTLVMLGLLLIASPVLAIASPDDLQINAVYVFHHLLETNDQLYLVEYFADYDIDADPETDDNPDENITEAYLGRLMDGVDELGAVAPYAYYDLGYDKGIFAIYFSASDAPTWNGAYTMKLMGNPTLDWDAAIPSTSVDVFDLWSSSTGIVDTQNELAARILYLADQLELTWGINMVDSTGTGSYLSSYGEAYFTNAIPNIQTMAPKAFAGSTTQPQWEYKEATTEYAEDRADSIVDTPLDMTPVADWWGVSRMWTSSLLFMLGGIFILYCILSPTGNYRPLVLLSTPLIIAGGYLGMLPLLATVLMGFAAFALSIFTLFYHPSGV
jgi:hypothetical protein